MLKRGDANCVHHEYIEGVIGTCVICGQVREYPKPVVVMDKETARLLSKEDF